MPLVQGWQMTNHQQNTPEKSNAVDFWGRTTFLSPPFNVMPRSAAVVHYLREVSVRRPEQARRIPERCHSPDQGKPYIMSDSLRTGQLPKQTQHLYCVTQCGWVFCNLQHEVSLVYLLLGTQGLFLPAICPQLLSSVPSLSGQYLGHCLS